MEPNSERDLHSKIYSFKACNHSNKTYVIPGTLQKTGTDDEFDGGIRNVSKGPPWFRSQRYTLAFILFGVMVNIFWQRSNLSLAIVCMVNHTATNPPASTSTHALTTSTVEYPHASPDLLHQHQTTAGTAMPSEVDSSSTSFSSSSTNPFVYVKSVHQRKTTTESFKAGLITTSNQRKILYQHQTTSITDDNINLQMTTDLSSPPVTERVLQSWVTMPSDIVKIELSPLRGVSSKWNLVHATNDEIFDTTQASDVRQRTAENDVSDGPFHWDKKTQGILLGAVFWTYTIVCVPGDALVRNISNKLVVAVSVGVMSCVTLLIPVSAWLSPWAVFAIKLIQGVCSPLVILGIYGMIGKWAPPKERTFLVSFTFAGPMCSNALVFPISGYLCKSGFLGGWPSIFYVFGVIGLAWTVVFVAFTADTPDLHPSITTEEAHYIRTSLSHSTDSYRPKVPWRALMGSSAVWAILLLNYSYTWGLFLLMSTMPQYMKEVLEFNIDSNGLYSMLPYLAMLVVGSTSGQVCSWVIQRDVIPLIWVRKIGAIIANVIPAILLIIVSFQDRTQSHVAVTLLTLAVGISGINPSVILPTPFDVAPPFAQTITAVASVLAGANGIVTPYIVAAITEDKTRSQWQTVFFLSSGVMVMGTLAFCIMGQSNVQAWAVPDSGSGIEINISNTVDEKSSSTLQIA